MPPQIRSAGQSRHVPPLPGARASCPHGQPMEPVPGSAGILPAAGRRPAIVHAGWKPALPGKASPKSGGRRLATFSANLEPLPGASEDPRTVGDLRPDCDGGHRRAPRGRPATSTHRRPRRRSEPPRVLRRLIGLGRIHCRGRRVITPNAREVRDRRLRARCRRARPNQTPRSETGVRTMVSSERKSLYNHNDQLEKHT